LKATAADHAVFSIIDPDGQSGYPGTMKIDARYELQTQVAALRSPTQASPTVRRSPTLPITAISILMVTTTFLIMK
jgi:hypothetical protein